MRELVSNDDARTALAALDRGPATFFRVPIAEELEVDGYVIKPPDFDPSARYPLLVYVYGEPAGQTVRDNWGGGTYLWHLMLSQMGYVVVSLDNRGTPSPRGRHSARRSVSTARARAVETARCRIGAFEEISIKKSQSTTRV